MSEYGKKASATVTARLTKHQKVQVAEAAAAHRLSVGEFAREALVRLSVETVVGGGDPRGLVDDLKKALGLAAETPPEDLLRAVSLLVDELIHIEGPTLHPGGSEALQSAPDPKPESNPIAKRSKHQIVLLAKRGLMPTDANWAAFCKSEVTKLGKDQRDSLKEKGLTDEGFVEARSKATRRAGDPQVGARDAAANATTLSKNEVAVQVARLDPDLRSKIKARGLTPEEFVERRANATRRA
jgi:hypothetical protein